MLNKEFFNFNSKTKPMDRIYLDLFLSGATYVIITYLAFQLMRKRKVNRNKDDDDNGNLETTPPKIDLPPGVVWSDSPLIGIKKTETVH